MTEKQQAEWLRWISLNFLFIEAKLNIDRFHVANGPNTTAVQGLCDVTVEDRSARLTIHQRMWLKIVLEAEKRKKKKDWVGYFCSVHISHSHLRTYRLLLNLGVVTRRMHHNSQDRKIHIRLHLITFVPSLSIFPPFFLWKSLSHMLKMHICHVLTSTAVFFKSDAIFERNLCQILSRLKHQGKKTKKKQLVSVFLEKGETGPKRFTAQILRSL